MIILRPKNVIFERFWPFSKFYFPACRTLNIIDKYFGKKYVKHLERSTPR